MCGGCCNLVLSNNPLLFLVFLLPVLARTHLKKRFLFSMSFLFLVKIKVKYKKMILFYYYKIIKFYLIIISLEGSMPTFPSLSL